MNASRKPKSERRSFLPVLGIGVLANGMPPLYLPCPFKFLTGVDCPGCGFQRSVVALWEGDILSSIQTYPPAIPILALFAFLGLKWLFKWDSSGRIAKVFGMVVGIVVLGAYGLKLGGVFPCRL